MKNILSAMLMAVSFSIYFQASAGFDEGVLAYEKSDFKTALAEWRPLAE